MNDGTATVFLVDDDPSILRALTRLLRVGGHHPTAAVGQKLPPGRFRSRSACILEAALSELGAHFDL